MSGRHSFPSPRLLLRDQVVFVAMIAGGLLVTLLAIAAGYTWRTGRTVDESYWHPVVTTVTPWYVGAVGIYLTVVALPRYLIYGDTRRRFLERLALFSGPFVFCVTALAWAGLVIERGAYRAAGWDHAVDANGPLDGGANPGSFGVEFLAILLPWLAFGCLIGAAYLLRPEYLVVAIPVGVVGVGVANAVFGWGDGPAGMLDRVVEIRELGTIAGLVVCVVLSVAALAGVRLLTRTIAIPSQNA